jgi:hypothetical protein
MVVHFNPFGAVLGCHPAQSNNPLKQIVAMLHRIIVITHHKDTQKGVNSTFREGAPTHREQEPFRSSRRGKACASG